MDGGGYPTRIAGYTASGVPFAYPPLVFWLVAVLATLTPLSVVAIVAWVPFALSIATVPLCY